MKVAGYTGKDDIATVYVAEMGDGKLIEFVESLQPPVPRNEKWVLIVSTLYGCPVGCPICDAGTFYKGQLSGEEIFSQIDFLLRKRYADGRIPVRKLKIQFARMGEPAFNPSVLEVLEELPERYRAPGLLPCLSTVAPTGTGKFFERLLEIKQELYKGRFQLQFSIHSTDEGARDRLIPVNKWGFDGIAKYGRRFYEIGDRKIALNFALAKGIPLDSTRLRKYFDPETFLIKITPVNPTYSAARNKLGSYLDPSRHPADYPVVNRLRACGYEVIVSIGEVRENEIGSNCGQYVMNHFTGKTPIRDSYTRELRQYRQSNRPETTSPEGCLQ
jgi:23S rRNA (adenine2503-C2)-methyltransferase